MPKGFTSLMSGGAAKRIDPGVKAPKKAPASASELKKAAKPTFRENDQANASRVTDFVRNWPNDKAKNNRGAMADYEERSDNVNESGSRPNTAGTSRKSITRPNAANTRARAANALLSKMPKKK